MQKFYEKAITGIWNFKRILNKGIILLVTLLGYPPISAQTHGIDQYQWQAEDCYLDFKKFEEMLPLSNLEISHKKESYQNVTLAVELKGFSEILVQYSACHHLVTTLTFTMPNKDMLGSAFDFAMPFIEATNKRAIPVIQAIRPEIGKSSNGALLYVGQNDHEQSLLLSENEDGYILEIQVTLSG